MKHIQQFGQFVSEKKEEKYIAHVDDNRKPGGSDSRIKQNYNLEVKNRNYSGFDIIGAKEDVEAFINDYALMFTDVELYEQFVSEKKAEKYIAHVDDNRKPGGSDSQIKKDYGLEVKNRDSSGFDIVGAKEDVEAFLDDYAIVFTDIELYEGAGYVEVMDLTRVANALGEIQRVWAEWKSGPMTEPKDIAPAQKDLKAWVDRWFKDNIK